MNKLFGRLNELAQKVAATNRSDEENEEAPSDAIRSLLSDGLIPAAATSTSSTSSSSGGSAGNSVATTDLKQAVGTLAHRPLAAAVHQVSSQNEVAFTPVDSDESSSSRSEEEEDDDDDDENDPSPSLLLHAWEKREGFNNDMAELNISALDDLLEESEQVDTEETELARTTSFKEAAASLSNRMKKSVSISNYVEIQTQSDSAQPTVKRKKMPMIDMRRVILKQAFRRFRENIGWWKRKVREWCRRWKQRARMGRIKRQAAMNQIARIRDRYALYHRDVATLPSIKRWTTPELCGINRLHVGPKKIFKSHYQFAKEQKEVSWIALEDRETAMQVLRGDNFSQASESGASSSLLRSVMARADSERKEEQRPAAAAVGAPRVPALKDIMNRRPAYQSHDVYEPSRQKLSRNLILRRIHETLDGTHYLDAVVEVAAEMRQRIQQLENDELQASDVLLHHQHHQQQHQLEDAEEEDQEEEEEVMDDADPLLQLMGSKPQP